MTTSRFSYAPRVCAIALFCSLMLPAPAAHAAARRARPAASHRAAAVDTSARTASPAQVVVSVNALKITRADFQKRAMREMRRTLMQSGLSETAMMSPEMAQFRSDFESRVANALVSRLLLLDAAQKAHIAVPGDSLQAAWNNVLRTFPSDDAMTEAFRRDGETKESVMKEIRESLMISNYLEKKIGEPKATDSDAYAFYDENRDRFVRPESVRARHILIADDTDGLKTVTDLKRQLDHGAKFDELAKASSIDRGSAARGGDLGYFPRGQMVPEFESAAFSLPAGKISEPVKTQFGYHLILVEDHKPETVVTFEEARDRCMQAAENKKMSDAVLALIESLKKPAKVVNLISR